MKKNYFITLWMSLAIASAMYAQQKAQIRIKKNVNGVESQETREVIIDKNNSLEDVLRDLNARPAEEEGLIDQQIEINIISEGDYAKLKQGSPSLKLPDFSEALAPQRKPTLGVMLKESACNRPNCEHEVVITEVVANSPAAKAGLQPGDIILAINKQDISSSQQVIQQVRNLTGGGELKLVVSRSGKKKKMKAVIPPASQFESRTNQFNLLLGPDSITMFNLPFGDSLKIIQPFNLSGEGLATGESAFLGVTPSGKSTTAGVSIRVEENSPAEAMGLMDDDIILEFNGETIGDFSSLAAAVRKCKPESSAELVLLREGKEKRITGSLGKRKQTASDDFQILHDFKGMDDEGNYFYDFEFNMDADDLQQQMQELFRNFPGSPSIDGYNMPNSPSNYLLSIEDADEDALSKLELKANSLSFQQFSLVPEVSRGAIEIQFALDSPETVQVQLKDREGHTLLYDEKQLQKGSYQRTLELAAYPAGNYYIIIEQAGRTFVKQIVKYKP